MDGTSSQAFEYSSNVPSERGSFDYSYVSTPARIALYDDLRSAPRITEIPPAETNSYIEKLTTGVYEQAKAAGGSIPYTVIREVSENFIHAYFKEIIVSILDGGDTIRFADQGPGITSKDKATEPGFSSAIEPMKRYIRGVGSGLPIVREYLDFSGGRITIEDNLEAGAVITISMHTKEDDLFRADDVTQRTIYHDGYGSERIPASIRYANYENAHIQSALAPLSQKERSLLSLLLKEGPSGVTVLSQMTGLAPSSTHAMLKKLEEAGLIERTSGKKRMLTPFGRSCSQNL